MTHWIRSPSNPTSEEKKGEKKEKKTDLVYIVKQYDTYLNTYQTFLP